jgi:hypothetical protein
MNLLNKVFAGLLVAGTFLVGAAFLLLVALCRAAVFAISPLRNLINTLAHGGQRG